MVETRRGFDKAPPEPASTKFPGWVERGLRAFVAANDPVPVLRTDDLRLPLDLHGKLMSGYIDRQRPEPDLTFQRYVIEVLRTVTPQT